MLSGDDLVTLEFRPGCSWEAFCIPEEAVSRGPYLGRAVIIGLIKSLAEMLSGEGVDLPLITRDVASMVVFDFFNRNIALRFRLF